MRPGDPVWTEKVEEQDLAQDPLAMNRVINRLLEDLLPGITTISPRARYISHHLWAAKDVLQRENPESQPQFHEGMYQRERILLLVSVQHDESDTTDQRNHQEIVGSRKGRKIITRDDDPLQLDFRFFANRAGSFGQAYTGPLKTMGLLEVDEVSGFEVPTDQGEDIARAYGELADASGLASIAQQDSIAQSELSQLPVEQCLCQVCEPNAPDRGPLRDLYLGRTSPTGYRTSARSRGRSLLLFLHLARRTPDGTNLTPGQLLDGCYFGSIETEDGFIPADIPSHLSAQASRWKVLRAHDYLTFATEVVFEAWLAYLEANPHDATIPGFKQEAVSDTVLEGLEARCNVENLEPTTSLSEFLTGIWPDSSATAFLQGDEVVHVPITDSMSEYSLDAALDTARSEQRWTDVHATWPCLTLAMALRFSMPSGEDYDAWEWMTSHTESDLSPARFRKELKHLLSNDGTLEEFFAWFIEGYVINQAEEVRRERARDSTTFRGWFEPKGGHWEKTRDYSAGHWSARFYSARSVLRDLALLDPSPGSGRITSDAEAVLEKDIFETTNDS